MSQENKQISFQEYIGGRRNQIVLAYDGAKEIALRNFDDLTVKLAEQYQVTEALKTSKEKNPVEPKAVKDKNRNKKE